MSSEKPLRIMELPCVAIGEILSFFDPVEIIESSKISRRFASMAQFAGYVRSELTLDFRTGKIIIKSNGVTYELFVLETLGTRIRVHKIDQIGRQRRYLNWDNSREEWMQFGFYISQLFNCQIKGFHTGHNAFSKENFQQIVGRIIRRQREIQDLSLFLPQLPDAELNYILDNIRVNQDLFINIHRVPTLNYTFLYSPRIIRIVNSGWFTSKNLQEVKDAVMIKLENSNLTNKSLDLYLKKWTAGNYMMLQYLEVSGKNLDMTTPILHFHVPIEGIGREMNIRINDYNLTQTNGLAIHRNDGKEALIKFVQDENSDFTFTMMLNRFSRGNSP